MIDLVKRFFRKATAGDGESPQIDTEHNIRVATCALFLEMGKIDKTFSKEEMAAVLSILKEKYGLSEENADALVAAADEELKESIDYWQFTNLINNNYTTEEKIEIIEMLWRIVYVDGKLDKYEDYLMHKLATLLRLSHKQLMDAKLKVSRSSQREP